MPSADTSSPIDPTVLAYLAGVIDSDGWISAAKSWHSGYLYLGAAIGISGTRREPHDLAASLFGGTVATYHPKGDRAGHRIQFQWQRFGQTAVPVLEAVVSFLRVKREQADLALQLQEELEYARAARGDVDAYPWFGPDYDPGPGLIALADQIRSLNVRGKRRIEPRRDERLWEQFSTAPTRRPKDCEVIILQRDGTQFPAVVGDGWPA